MFIPFPPSDFVLPGVESIPIPRVAKVRQVFDNTHIENLPAHIERELNTKVQNKEWYRGKRICITAGSRGIHRIDEMLRAVIGVLRSWGASPFLVPAMGSHGGASAEGQLEMLSTFGITEEAMGAPILSSMDTVQYSTLADGTPLHLDRNAFESDGIVVMNKVKPHTNFHGIHESGICKMIVIGLSKHIGASFFHAKGFDGFPERMPLVCEEFFSHCPFAFGVGIVENAYNDTLAFEVVSRENFVERDAELLLLSKRHIPEFKHPRMDVVMIDEIGKDINGTGFDPNVVSHDVLDYQKLFVRRLTEGTHHNGCGSGNIDITTQRMLNDIDWKPTWTNVATSTTLFSGRIPMYANSDKEAIQTAIRTCNDIDFHAPKFVRIKNTLSLDVIEVSEAYWECIKDRDDVERIGDFEEITFGADGYIAD